MKLPPTAQRVENNTCRSAKEDIRNKTIFQIEQALKDGNIDREMAMLQREWDTAILQCKIAVSYLRLRRIIFQMMKLVLRGIVRQ